MAAVKNPLLWAAVVVFGIYTIVAFLVPSRQLIEFSDGIAIAMSGAVMFLYGSRCWPAVIHRKPDLYDLIMVGIAGGWATNMVDRSYRLYARVTDSPEMLNSPFIAFILTALAFFAALHLAARGPSEREIAERREVSIKAKAAIIVALFVGAGIGTLAIAIDYGLFEGNR